MVGGEERRIGMGSGDLGDVRGRVVGVGGEGIVVSGGQTK